MTRDTEFRGKRKDSGEWISGHGIFIDNAAPGSPVYIYSDKHSKWAEVIPETAGRYTGLKDKKGAKIFEGDIVNVPGQKQAINEVAYEDGTFSVGIRYKGNFDGMWYLHIVDGCKVIGNIHDNPELLKEEP